MKLIAIRNILSILIPITFVSCSVFQNGMTNHNEQYVPIKPHYKLKDKQEIFPIMLDTIGVYKMTEMYNNGVLVYPISNSRDDLNNIYNYIRFYKNGRCLIFTIPSKNDLGMSNLLKESDLNPNNKNYSKSYYYSSNGTKIQIESFVCGDGKGHYVILDYMLSATGDTLLMQDKYVKIIYKKETIPLHWKSYKATW
ncbi:MAG: hypothetical protein LBE34_02385 [Flavobacteriaceae bacterium]|jgi:hypothetical protein|nr:hypothetical protein [Flavobacteriaceae bacterium]